MLLKTIGGILLIAYIYMVSHAPVEKKGMEA